MDTDCLQEEISVIPERTSIVNSNPVPSRKDDKEDAGGMQGSTRHWNSMKEIMGGSGTARPTSRIEAAKLSLKKAVNGDGGERSTEGGGEEDFKAPSEVAMLRDAGLTPSPSPRFKSSYAKSLADSYRRASIPVVVSSSKGQFYFKNDDFLSLSASPVRRADSSREKYYSMSMNGDGKAQLTHNSEPQSLPPFNESQEQQQQEIKKSKKKSYPSSLPTSVYERLLDEDVFVPFEQLHRVCEEQGSSFSLKDWHNLGSIITSDGRKLVKLSDVKIMNVEEQPSKTQNGHHLLVNDSEKDSQQVETLLMEHGQLGGRVNQLCRVLADRDATIQRLEEDLLRIRMECQRLIVDNRSLKSSLGHRGASQTHPSGADNPSQVSQLQQQVQLLTAQLNKAEQSRHTYEAATRQLVDFLHTVNSTLNNASHLNNTSSSPATSPACSLHSSASTTTVKTSSSIPAEAEDDPPYQLARPSTPPPETLASRHAVGHTTRSSAEAMKKAGSVWAIPTHNHNHHSRKVSRAASTHCVASIASSYQGEPGAAAAASPGSERRRSFTSDFLASRARELLASLKSIMRSDSVLKLNLEPKKSGSSASGGRSRSSSKNTKVEITPSVPSADTEPPIKAFTVSISPQSSEAEGSRQPTTLTVPVDGGGSEKNSLTMNENDASLAVSEDLDTTSTTVASIPRIGTGKTREDTLQPQSSVLNGNPQPLSLMVVGEHPCNPSDQRFSSLPVCTRITRTLTDADHRLVWV